MDSAWAYTKDRQLLQSLRLRRVQYGRLQRLYFINGTVTENGKMTQVSVNVSRRFTTSPIMFANGLNLFTDKIP